MNYKVTINDFEGPMDLLLHLIKENNIDIYDISVEQITKQYLDFIKEMKELNLSIASEYLVLASELLEIKSKMLLPKPKIDESDDFEEDPREILIERLIAYKKYKEITSEFKELEEKRKLFLTKEPENLNLYLKESDNKENLCVDDLIKAFNELLKRKELDKPIATKITKKELSVKDKINNIRSILRSKKQIKFEELFLVTTKEEIIINFLSILEMAKKDEININQDNNFNTIVISLKEDE